jgi:6-phosphogluconolactonase
MAEKGAEIVAAQMREVLLRRPLVNIALSGGSTPRPLHARLALPPHVDGVPWSRLHFFWVDERMVPRDHPHSNFGAARRDLLEKVPVEAQQLHPMPVGLPAKEGALRYGALLAAHFKTALPRYPVFDLVLLGLGADGHSASLFPGSPPAADTAVWVAAVKGGIPPFARLTLTYGVLNHARQLLFLVSGREKAAVMETLWTRPDADLPAGRIRQRRGRAIWLADSAAVSRLPKHTGAR